jgi:hypothetical protein
LLLPDSKDFYFISGGSSMITSAIGWSLFGFLVTCAFAIFMCAVAVVIRMNNAGANPIYIGPPGQMPVPAAVPVPAAGGAGAHPNEQDLVDSLVSYNLFKIPVLVRNVVVVQLQKNYKNNNMINGTIKVIKFK